MKKGLTALPAAADNWNQNYNYASSAKNNPNIIKNQNLKENIERKRLTALISIY